LIGETGGAEAVGNVAAEGGGVGGKELRDGGGDGLGGFGFRGGLGAARGKR